MKTFLIALFAVVSASNSFANSACEAWLKTPTAGAYQDSSFQLSLSSQSNTSLDAASICNNIDNGQLCIKGNVKHAGPLLSALLDKNPTSEFYQIDYPSDSAVLISTIPRTADPYNTPDCVPSEGMSCPVEAPMKPVCTDNGCTYAPFPVQASVVRTFVFSECPFTPESR